MSKIDNESLAALRVEYASYELDESHVSADPFEQFEKWFSEALETKVNEPNAMTLATVKPDGTPSARIVLLKGFDKEGLSFFTNYESRKGEELSANPHVAIVFCWLELHRQVRIEGYVTKLSDAESDAYFKSRPEESQIGAVASPQSRSIESRKEIEKRFEDAKMHYQNVNIMRPMYWGGYKVHPVSFEFWQGRKSRLHDRLRYNKMSGESWQMVRLAP